MNVIRFVCIVAIGLGIEWTATLLKGMGQIVLVKIPSEISLFVGDIRVLGHLDDTVMKLI